jgi:Fe2+ or Zn2+ uptake regulation protein
MAYENGVGSMCELILLAIIGRNNDAQARQIYKALNAAGHPIRRTTVYAALDRMEGENLVQHICAIGSSQRFYSVTPTGRIVLKAAYRARELVRTIA